MVAATAIAACGGGDDSETDGTSGGDDDTSVSEPGTDDSAVDTMGSDPTSFEQPEGEPDLDATFIYGYPIGVSRLDPHKASISQDATTLFPVYDRLVHLSPDGKLIPGLAESWEFSDGGRTLTLHVRPNVTFHDGTKLDAEGVKVNLDRAVGIEGSSVATDLVSIESVKVVDPMTVEIGLSAPDVSVVGALADRAGILVSPKAIADGVDLDAKMVGAGPYKFVSHVQDNSTKFVRNDDYWDKQHLAKVKNLEIRVLAESTTRLNAIRTGQINATTLTPTDVEAIEANTELRVMYITELAYMYIVQNRARSNQDDVRVRQALMYGLDRESMCESLLKGQCVITDQPFPPGYYAYDDDMPQVLYPYDPEKAKSLLDEAGVSELDLSMLTPSGLPTYPDVAQVIQAQWAELGVNVEIQPTVPQTLGEVMFAQEKGDTMLATWGGRPDPAMTLDQRAGPESFANPGGVTTDKMVDLIAQAKSITDPAKRDAALQAGSKEMAESVLEMVVFFPKTPYVASSDAVFTPYLTSKPEFRDVAILK